MFTVSHRHRGACRRFPRESQIGRQIQSPRVWGVGCICGCVHLGGLTLRKSVRPRLRPSGKQGPTAAPPGGRLLWLGSGLALRAPTTWPRQIKPKPILCQSNPSYTLWAIPRSPALAPLALADDHVVRVAGWAGLGAGRVGTFRPLAHWKDDHLEIMRPPPLNN